MKQLWEDVDTYFGKYISAGAPDLDFILENSEKAGLPAIAVSPAQGKLLHLWVKTINAKRILEIGTLGGYSTAWMAHALPEDGQVVSLEFDPHHAATARKNLDQAGVGSKVDIRVGSASDNLPHLANDPQFDLVFIDADKRSTPIYFDWAVRLTHPGSIIVVDNVVRDGRILDSEIDDLDVQGIQKFFDGLGNYPGVQVTAIQTVGLKGYDGFAFGLVTG